MLSLTGLQPAAFCGPDLTLKQRDGLPFVQQPAPRYVRTFISAITARMIVAGLILTVTTTRNVFRMSRTTFRVAARR
jgi:hypothetical protein